MAKFCPNCGAMLDDSTVFCSSCGTKVESQPQPQYNQSQYAQPQYDQQQFAQPDPQYQYAQQPQQDPNYNQYANYGYQADPAPQPTAPNGGKKKSKKKFFIIGGIALTLVIAIVLVCVLVFFPSPKSVANKFMNAVVDGDAEKAVDYMPSFLWENDDDTKEELINYLDEYLFDYLIDEYDIEFELDDADDLSRSEKEELKALFEECEEYIDDFDADDIDVDKAKIIEAELTIDGDDEETMILVIIKYKGQNKVLPVEYVYTWLFYLAFGD